MEILLQVKTPKGAARKTEAQIRPFILGPFKSNKYKTWTNEEDNEIYWQINDDLRRVMKIQRNVGLYHTMIQAIFMEKHMARYTGRNLSKEDQATLKDLLENQTTVTIIKKATQEEKDEYGETWWEKTKKKLKIF